MNVESYLEQKKMQAEQAPQYRHLCKVCIQPSFGCYCNHIKSFDLLIKFVVLIHPIEVRRRIATGRMSHLILQGSHLISGQDYSQNSLVNELIEDKSRKSIILYPGVKSYNLSGRTEDEKAKQFSNEPLTIFVIDGTWATARKMIRQSENLISLPRVCFTPDKPSNFRVRKQPAPNCYSTIEAIHQTIELIGQSQGFDVQSRLHDRLLESFDGMVERQLECIRNSDSNPHPRQYRRYSKTA